MAELPRRRTHALVLEPCPEAASRLIKTCFQTTRTLYSAVVLDLFTRKIVDWAMRDLMRAELTIAALTMAIQRQKPPPGLTHYSDRGSQYAAADYRKVLDAAGI
jgi:transposase InsO family protein